MKLGLSCKTLEFRFLAPFYGKLRVAQFPLHFTRLRLLIVIRLKSGSMDLYNLSSRCPFSSDHICSVKRIATHLHIKYIRNIFYYIRGWGLQILLTRSMFQWDNLKLYSSFTHWLYLTSFVHDYNCSSSSSTSVASWYLSFILFLFLLVTWVGLGQ